MLNFFWTQRHARGLKTQPFFSSNWSWTKCPALAPDPLQCQSISETNPIAGEVFLGTFCRRHLCQQAPTSFCWWLEKTYWMSTGKFILFKHWTSFQTTSNRADYWFNTNGNWPKDPRLFGWLILKPFSALASMQNISKEYSYQWRAYKLNI